MQEKPTTLVDKKCRICGKRARNPLVVKGRWYVDNDGERRRAADSVYHRECHSMQRRGLLFAGHDGPVRDSAGSACRGCNQTIEHGDKHAHRNGNPYHKECLT